jgi:hypothetical protein
LILELAFYAAVFVVAVGLVALTLIIAGIVGLATSDELHSVDLEDASAEDPDRGSADPPKWS